MQTKTRVQAVQELRRSNAAVRHALKARKGTRGARKAAAIREQEQGR